MSVSKRATTPCPDDVIEAIRAMLDYLRDDERRDYVSNPRTGHVFESIARVEAWLVGLDWP